jgi:hypothetical protein
MNTACFEFRGMVLRDSVSTMRFCCRARGEELYCTSPDKFPTEVDKHLTASPSCSPQSYAVQVYNEREAEKK